MKSQMHNAAAWRLAPLSSVVEKIVDGSHNPPPKQSEGFPMLSARNVGIGRIDFTEFRYIAKEAFDLERKRADLRPGDVLLTIVGTIGRAAVIPDTAEDFALQRSVAMIRPRELMPKFCMYQLLSPRVRNWLKEHARGSAQQGVYLRTLGTLPMLVAPRDQQERIVAEIEKQFTRLDAGVVSLKRVQVALKRYRATVLKAACEGRLVPTEAELARREARSFEPADVLLQRILKQRREKWNGRGKYKEPAAPDIAELPPLPEGWTWCMSDAVFTFVTSGSRGWAKYYSEAGPIFLRIGNLNHEDIHLDLRDIQHVRPPTGAEGTRTIVEPNDILASITADIGMVALVPEKLGEAYINQHVALARPVSSLRAEYIAYYLCGSEGGWKHLKKLQRGATKVGLGLDDIRSVPIPVPPVAEQQRIVVEVERRLSVIEEIEALAAANLQRAARLRQSILSQTFTAGCASTKE